MTQTQNKSAYRSGFVTIIGSPNVGKSTLMNRMVGQKISIVSDRAQTTRNRITGIVSRKDYQIIFLDTPGVTAPKNRLGEYMLKVAFDAVNEVEAILLTLPSVYAKRMNCFCPGSANDAEKQPWLPQLTKATL